MTDKIIPFHGTLKEFGKLTELLIALRQGVLRNANEFFWEDSGVTIRRVQFSISRACYRDLNEWRLFDLLVNANDAVEPTRANACDPQTMSQGSASAIGNRRYLGRSQWLH